MITNKIMIPTFFLAYDLPQRPNEAQIFFGNISKVILSLLGTTEASDSGESEHTEFGRASQHLATDSDRYELHGITLSQALSPQNKSDS